MITEKLAVRHLNAWVGVGLALVGVEAFIASRCLDGHGFPSEERSIGYRRRFMSIQRGAVTLRAFYHLRTGMVGESVSACATVVQSISDRENGYIHDLLLRPSSKYLACIR